MTLHPFVIAYGQRRGYAMADMNRIFSQDSSNLFSSSSTILDSATNPDSSSSATIDFSPASDLMSNWTDVEAYLNELNLLASFFNSSPAAVRRRLRLYVEGVFSHFNERLQRVGHAADILTSALDEFQFPQETDSDSIENGVGIIFDDNANIDRVVKNFLCKFETPLINEYFRSTTNLFVANSDVDGIVRNSDQNSPTSKNENDAESENEEDVEEDPPWWKKGTTTMAEAEDSKEKIDSDLDSILDEIRDASIKLASIGDVDSVSLSFPYSIKTYAFSNKNSTRGRNAAVCADVNFDGGLACFGCDGDSSINYFSLRSFDARRSIGTSSAVVEKKGNILHTNSTSGIVYRIGFLESDQNGGSFLLTASDNSSSPIQLFDLESNRKLYDYRGHRWPVWALDSTKRGGGLFVTGSYDRTARLFSLDRKDPIRILVGHESSVDCVRFIFDQANRSEIDYPSYVGTASSDGTVRVWSLRDAVAVRVFHGIKGSPTALAYRGASPNGSADKLLACATTEGQIFVWELETGRTYQILEGVLSNDLEFSDDGRFLVAGGDGGFFKIYRLSRGGNDSGNQYVEMQFSENLLFHNNEAKVLKMKFIGNELICLTA